MIPGLASKTIESDLALGIAWLKIEVWRLVGLFPRMILKR